MTTAQGADELRIQGLLRRIGVGPDAVPPPSVEPPTPPSASAPVVPPARERTAPVGRADGGPSYLGKGPIDLTPTPPAPDDQEEDEDKAAVVDDHLEDDASEEDEEDQEDHADGHEPGAEDAPPANPGTARLIATTVQEWRPPTGPRGRGWIRAVAYTGSGIVLGWLTGYTQAVYTTLDQLSVNPDAVGGIAISAAMAALMISRSKKTWIGLGCALLLVLVVEYLTVPVFAGAIATTVVWGLDQRARHMRHVIAWTTRAAFGSVLLASFALVWTTVVHYFTGAVQ
ncbi:hypothetical protein ACFRQM_09450 [Streptomyces sp. NPDC056831]|uniref:hypothetical protein n=1 Tax=Streptomyces sp. NPDC056831 TaxID=3345954 RepID=UPI003690EFAE